MSLYLFSGPSLPPQAALSMLPGAVCEGPARCGDVYRAVGRGATIIAICDGYFEHLVPVWHKEILWALSRGVRVYGAASLGALRAAELHVFGMRGVGRIFEQFRDGTLTDDDEVAIIHEPAERGYRVRCDAMVNIRATLEAAVRAGALHRSVAERLVQLAKAMFYPERSFAHLLARAIGVGEPSSDVHALKLWLSRHSVVDQKALDAQALVQELVREQSQPTPLSGSNFPFVFQYTDAWHALTQAMASKHAGDEGSPLYEPVDGRVQAEALERALALSLADDDGFEPDAADIQSLSEVFREERGLFDAEQTSAWLSARNLDLEDFSRFIYESLLVDRYRVRARQLATSQQAAARLSLPPIQDPATRLKPRLAAQR